VSKISAAFLPRTSHQGTQQHPPTTFTVNPQGQHQTASGMDHKGREENEGLQIILRLRCKRNPGKSSLIGIDCWAYPHLAQFTMTPFYG